MSKQIPISDDLSEYFTAPCPVLSDNNARMIFARIGCGYDWVVEYGMGASTLYFLDAILATKSKMISVENNFDWFQICVQKIEALEILEKTSHWQKPWAIPEIQTFLKKQPSASDIPEHLKRLPRWQESLSTGPFFRFSPHSKSRFRGKFGSLWPIFKPLFQSITWLAYCLWPGTRPVNAESRFRKGDFELILRNVSPTIKDQYGEAPNIDEYIDAGLGDIRKELESGKKIRALFIIDGGPRHKIVKNILALEDAFNNFSPAIFLCDASREFYHPTLAKRPDGRFIAGTNITLKGAQVSIDVSPDLDRYWIGGGKTVEEQAAQEIWFYESSQDREILLRSQSS